MQVTALFEQMETLDVRVKSVALDSPVQAAIEKQRMWQAAMQQQYMSEDSLEPVSGNEESFTQAYNSKDSMANNVVHQSFTYSDRSGDGLRTQFDEREDDHWESAAV